MHHIDRVYSRLSVRTKVGASSRAARTTSIRGRTRPNLFRRQARVIGSRPSWTRAWIASTREAPPPDARIARPDPPGQSGRPEPDGHRPGRADLVRNNPLP